MPLSRPNLPDRIHVEIAISAAFVKVIGRDPCHLHGTDHVPLDRSPESEDRKHEAGQLTGAKAELRRKAFVTILREAGL